MEKYLIELENYKKEFLNNNKEGIFQLDSIPIYNSNLIDLNDEILKKKIYENFFNGSGALIIKNGYNVHLMNEYNNWCEKMLNNVKNDKNFIHPKQKDKYLINNVIERMSENNPDLLIKLLTNKYLLNFIDILLGFARIGSCTTHWIEPGGDRQISHVDYPIHVGSGAFWENNSEKVKRFITPYQLNNILPYYSIQLLIASDDMDISNGSTEIVPFSQKIKDIDLLILKKEMSDLLEPHFKNVKLEKGDMLIFNRRLCHRGGKNISNMRRNSLIFQCVWFWGIGQEILNDEIILKNLEKGELYKKLTKEKIEELKLRLKNPYPIDVSKKT